MIQKIECGKRLNVLSLEDSALDFEIIKEELTGEGYDLNIDRAVCKSEFESLIRTNKYDIILADFKLIGFDAFGALDIRNSVCPDIPFICVSGSIGEETAIELIRCGAVDYVLKDKPKRLPFAVNQALKESEERKSRKQAEETVRESQKILEDILESTLSGYWDWNIPDNTEYFSPALKKMFGYETDELPDTPHTWQKLIFEEDLPEVMDILDRHIKSYGLEPFYSEARYHHRDGSTIWVICAGRVIEWTRDASPIRIVGCYIDITERKKAEEKIKHSLEEKQILLRELYHRTKNNMQVICSMLSIRSSQTKDKNIITTFNDMQSRIKSMAMVHEKLYKSKNLSSINLGEYINNLVDYLVGSYGISMDRISLIMDLDDINVLIDTALPVGMILTEIILNVFKHAFPGNMKGKVELSLHTTHENVIELKIKDNGIGFSENDINVNDKIGIKTILSLANEQIRGQARLDTSCGVAWTIRFEDIYYDERI